MKYRISSLLTIPYKLIGLLLIVHSFSLIIFFFTYPTIIFIFLYFIFSVLLYRWIGSFKHVSINKNGLYISNLWKKIYLPFSAIESVSEPNYGATSEIVINLFNSSPFGKKIRFAPKFLQANKIAKKLESLSRRRSAK
jgi:hypothetical protein